MASNRRDSTKEKMNKKSNESGPKKKQIPPPTNLLDFGVVFLLTMSKKILLMETYVKIGLYLICVLAGSVFADVIELPKTYLSNKNNIINQFFVKFGWGWTFLMLTVFITLTSYVYNLGKKDLVKVHLLRLGMATFWWYTMVSLIDYIESMVGVCTGKGFYSRNICVQKGKSWLGFDISGHVFLLVHNLLTISEEVKCFKDWKKLGEILSDEDLSKKKNIKPAEVKEGKKYYKVLTPYINCVFVIIACFTLLWEFMLIISTVYRFHTTSQKIVAVFMAISCWFASYRLILGIGRTGSLKLLLRPGESVLRFTKHLT